MAEIEHDPVQGTADAEKTTRGFTVIQKRKRGKEKKKKLVHAVTRTTKVYDEGQQAYKLSNLSLRVCKLVKCSGLPLTAKIRPWAPLSSNENHLQGPPVILTYAAILWANTVKLQATIFLFIPAEQDFDMCREKKTNKTKTLC